MNDQDPLYIWYAIEIRKRLAALDQLHGNRQHAREQAKLREEIADLRARRIAASDGSVKYRDYGQF